MPKKDNNIFFHCINFLEIILKINSSNILKIEKEIKKLD